MSADPYTTEDSTMSEVAPVVDTDDSIQETVNQLAERVAAVEAQNETLRRENGHLQERVDELEAKQESQASLSWESNEIEDLKLVHPDLGFEYPLGLTLSNKISPKDIEKEYDVSLESVINDVEALKRGEVDPTDLAAAFDPEMPIEADVAKALDDVMQSDLSANEKRAVQVFRAFGGRSRKWSGDLKIESGDVRNILEGKGETDPNPNTVKRTMKMAAKKTSDKPEGERDPFAEENLLTLHKGENCLELRADRDEWNDYTEEVQERVDR